MLTDRMLRFVLAREDLLVRASEAAAADGHSLVAPKFLAMKDGEFVGAVGITPCVHLWLHTQKCHARDAAETLNFFENQLAVVPDVDLIALPCVDKSPLKPFVDRVGYVDAGRVNVYFKNLKA